ncbi:hypothetical protein [Priestia megaterium]|uniref:hypothetical protein n=1 Tax=Priestia megaterium TaxID=1404 RepID=UPI000BFDDB67|nr:hypothetical protein [Priestia megaterium]PGQ88230.1 hypothetical protein COA18_04705 [Priestia megaterium]
MNKLQESKYPFLFFPEEAFHAGQVVNYIANSYVNVLEATREEVITPDSISMRDYHTSMLGLVGRVVKLGEDHIDLFHTEAHNQYIRELAVKHNGDLLKVTDEYLNQDMVLTGLSNEMRELLNHDIRKALNMTNMFYMDSQVPYGSLQFFKNEEDQALFSDSNIDRLFHNVPIKRVW